MGLTIYYTDISRNQLERGDHSNLGVALRGSTSSKQNALIDRMLARANAVISSLDLMFTFSATARSARDFSKCIRRKEKGASHQHQRSKIKIL